MMLYNAAWIGGAWLVATVFALAPRSLARLQHRGHWAAPLAITAFCLGLFLGVENSAKGQFRSPFAHHTHRHLVHHTATR